MTLATVKSNGTPSARIVLLKGMNDAGFSFFTNYDSHKGAQLSHNNAVALVFCWLELQRQVRIEGVVEKLSTLESDHYFDSRPRASQIGAHTSNQSATIANRTALEVEYTTIENRYLNKKIPRPENWGGYLVKPNLIEFWQGRQSRLHDRLVFERHSDSWKIDRLAP
jgi:pyridoxamine 5'-phosphate oxidase